MAGTVDIRAEFVTFIGDEHGQNVQLKLDASPFLAPAWSQPQVSDPVTYLRALGLRELSHSEAVLRVEQWFVTVYAKKWPHLMSRLEQAKRHILEVLGDGLDYPEAMSIASYNALEEVERGFNTQPDRTLAPPAKVVAFSFPATLLNPKTEGVLGVRRINDTVFTPPVWFMFPVADYSVMSVLYPFLEYTITIKDDNGNPIVTFGGKTDPQGNVSLRDISDAKWFVDPGQHPLGRKIEWVLNAPSGDIRGLLYDLNRAVA